MFAENANAEGDLAYGYCIYYTGTMDTVFYTSEVYLHDPEIFDRRDAERSFTAHMTGVRGITGVSECRDDFATDRDALKSLAEWKRKPQFKNWTGYNPCNDRKCWGR